MKKAKCNATVKIKAVRRTPAEWREIALELCEKRAKGQLKGLPKWTGESK